MTILHDSTWKHIYKKTKHIFATEILIYMEINIHLRVVHFTKEFNIFISE